MAPDPVFLGTYVRNNIEFSDYFSANCPDCGQKLYPYHIDGCPTNERVDLINHALKRSSCLNLISKQPQLRN